jgi:hypothetical protein
MKDLDFEIRMQLLRAQPNLSLTQANEMIADIARCFFEIQKDNAARGVTLWEDFWNLCHLKGVALVSIYRESLLEILVFTADDALIHDSEHIAACEVEAFLRLIRGRFRAPEVGLQVPMSEALPWMEKTNAENHETA